MGFVLDEKLQADTHHVLDLKQGTVLLMDDKRFPWLILVPRIEGAREPHHLTGEQQLQFHAEICLVMSVLEKMMHAEKMNLAMLGNMVPQLHAHIIARNSVDEAWPNPVWGYGEKIAYTDQESKDLITKLCHSLEEHSLGSKSK